MACQPDTRVRLYSVCIVDGVRYHTIDREHNRKTQNSGILTEGDHDGEPFDFYGQLRSVIELQYNSSGGVDRSVVLFSCDWFDIGGKKKTGLRDDGHFTSVNTGRFWYKSHPFILTSQATKVFYVPDTRFGGKWRVVQKFMHRHLWRVTEIDGENGPGGGGLTYQDEKNGSEILVQAREATVQTRLRRDQNDRVRVDAAVVQGIKKQRRVIVDEEEDGADDTMLQYCSDDGEDRTGHGGPRCGIDNDE